jgi:hypothetical protein
MKKFILFGLCLMLIATFSCKKNTDDPAPVPYSTFKVKGVQKTYKFYSKFTKDFCSTSTYCCRFYMTSDTASYETIKFGIPGDPLVGYVYSTGENRFSCFYVDSLGVRYDLTTQPFSVVFTQWQGQGGWAKGYFSGWMASPAGDSIQFTNGYFQNTIWTMGTK